MKILFLLSLYTIISGLVLHHRCATGVYDYDWKKLCYGTITVKNIWLSAFWPLLFIYTVLKLSYLFIIYLNLLIRLKMH